MQNATLEIDLIQLKARTLETECRRTYEQKWLPRNIATHEGKIMHTLQANIVIIIMLIRAYTHESTYARINARHKQQQLVIPKQPHQKRRSTNQQRIANTQTYNNIGKDTQQIHATT